MKEVEREMKDFVEDLYKGGAKPCERFGTSWEELGEVENVLLGKGEGDE